MKKLFPIIVLTACHGCNDVPPQQAARAWAQEMGLKVVGVSCSTIDTDNDGYVTCTVSTTQGEGVPQLHSIQCAQLRAPAGGCKLTPARAAQ